MSHTNSTTNYGLPQFLTGDKPAWLTDVNNAYADIDTAINAAQTKADTAFTDAGNAQSDATTAINNAAAADAKGSGALASIESPFDPTTIYSVGAKVMYNSLLYRCTVAVTTPGPWTGSSNWERITVDNLISTSDSKIGLLSSLSTTDKTSVVNAINEVNGSKMANNKTLFLYSNVNGENVTIPANGWADSPLTPTEISGYKPLCFMNVFTSSPSSLVIASFSADPNSMYVRLRNITSNPITGYGWGRVIYIANENAN